jgi:biofilm PGA synthesis lipoprotein PgaB
MRPSVLPAIALALAFLVLAAIARAEAPPPAPSLFALCYHDVEDKDPDQRFVGVSTANFAAQLEWLRRNGFHAVSLDDLLAARDGRKPLPDKAYLVTFDDGYESFYTRVFPILKVMGVPAVLAVEASWLRGGPGSTVRYGDASEPRGMFMTWDQVREVAASGLVEIASHTFDLHKGIPANPQGNSEPAAVTRRWSRERGYETASAYQARIEADTRRAVATFRRELGHVPRAVVWPYGEHSLLAVDVERRHAMPITLTLLDAPVSVAALSAIPRHLVKNDPGLSDFIAELHGLSTSGPVRAVQIDLDQVYDADPAQQERNLGALVQRIHDLQINLVFLQAFADPKGDGLVREVYFPNRELPMRADLFNRAAWQLRTRAKVAVWAWMPVLSFDFGAAGRGLQHVSEWRAAGEGAIDPAQYRRLSPFDPAVRRRIADLYEDLAAAAPFAGLLFHDDAMLSDFEDASPAALDAYAAAGLPRSIGAIRSDPALLDRWTRLKTDALIAFTRELAARARRLRTPMRTARNLYARPVLDPASRAWFAQDYDRFLAAYDLVAVMAMPRLEEVPGDPLAWLQQLVDAARLRPDGLAHTLFELQAVDWRRPDRGSEANLPTGELAREMRFLERRGAVNLGYYPDDFLRDHPRAQTLHAAFSLQSFPYGGP